MNPNSRQMLLRIALVLGVMALVSGVGVIFVVKQYIARIDESLPPVSKLETYVPPTPTEIYSRDGEKIGELFDEKRYPVALNKISPLLIKAFLAAEDSRFYEHKGIDYQGIMRAGINYFLKKGNKQGGSTITQQLAKNLLLTKERTFDRKIKDILLAQKIEKSFSKEKILELYLNNLFLGNNSYGVEAAARNYFRKGNKDLTLAEAAIIAGLAPAPSAYAPTDNLEKAKVRQKFVLEQMIKSHWATEADATKAFQQKLKIYRAEAPNSQAAPYFLIEVKKQLENSIKLEGLTSAGYKINTTVDMRLQRFAQTKVKEFLKIHENRKGFKGPVKRHGSNFEVAAKRIVNAPVDSEDEDLERAMVVDLIPNLDAAIVVSRSGLGILIVEDHTWALKIVGKSREHKMMDFADVLNVGDEVNVRKINRTAPRRIAKSSERLLTIYDKYAHLYLNSQSNKELRFLRLNDTEQVEASALVMHAQTGEVLAMIGGSSFENNEFNHATQARRQVGSSVKPLYYAYAMDHGFSPASQIDSPPIVIGDWKPENYSKEFNGRTTLRTSLIQSHNISSVQIFQALGATQVSQHFRKLGLDWPEADLSLALGSGEATLLQMVHAYSPFSNQGKLTEPLYITSIEDRDGNVLYDTTNSILRVSLAPQPKNKSVKMQVGLNAKQKIKPESTANKKKADLQIISPEAAYVTMRVMQDVIRFGTGTRAAGISNAAGKTGTTNGYSDAWFMGVLPGLVSGVWVGFDDQRKSLGGTEGTGGRMAAPLWREIMSEVTRLYPQSEWTEPEGVTRIRIDPETGLLALGGGGIVVPVVNGTEPGAPGAKNALGLSAFDKSTNSKNDSEDNSQTESENSDTSSLRSAF